MPKRLFLPTLRIALLALLTIGLGVPCAAQTSDLLLEYGRREPAGGARMAALVGAAAAGLGDWTASVVNPAGLAYLDRCQFVAAGHAFHAAESAPGDPARYTAAGLTLSTLGFAAPLPVRRGAFVLGGGYAERAVYPGLAGSDGGWQGEVAVAGAVALAPRLAAGLALNGIVGEGAGASRAGVRGRVGLSLALDYGVRLGLAVETPTYLRVEPQERLRIGEGEPPRPFALVTPWRFALGFLAGSETVLVTADVEVVDWSQARFDAGGDPGLGAENAFAGSAFRMVVHSRVGAEARLGAVALRTGAAFQPDPRFDGPVPEAVWQQYAVGAGVRLHPQAGLDVAFIHTRDRREPYFSGFVDTVRNAVQMGVDVRF